MLSRSATEGDVILYGQICKHTHTETYIELIFNHHHQKHGSDSAITQASWKHNHSILFPELQSRCKLTHPNKLSQSSYTQCDDVTHVNRYFQ